MGLIVLINSMEALMMEVLCFMLEKIFLQCSPKNKPSWESRSNIYLNKFTKKEIVTSSALISKNLIQKQLHVIRKNLVACSSKYENPTILGDLNAETNAFAVEEFIRFIIFKKMVKGLIYSANPDKPSCIDLLLTNERIRFQTSLIIENWQIWFFIKEQFGKFFFYKKERAY